MVWCGVVWCGVVWAVVKAAVPAVVQGQRALGNSRGQANAVGLVVRPVANKRLAPQIVRCRANNGLAGSRWPGDPMGVPLNHASPHYIRQPLPVSDSALAECRCDCRSKQYQLFREKVAHEIRRWPNGVHMTKFFKQGGFGSREWVRRRDMIGFGRFSRLLRTMPDIVDMEPDFMFPVGRYHLWPSKELKWPPMVPLDNEALEAQEREDLEKYRKAKALALKVQRYQEVCILHNPRQHCTARPHHTHDVTHNTTHSIWGGGRALR